MKHTVVKKLFAALGFLVIGLSLVPKVEAIGIRPIRYEVNVKPGETTEGTVTVINETEKDFSAEPSLLAFYKNDQNGFPIFVTEKNPELEDVTKWVELPKEPVLVPAKGSTNVKYKINVPASASPGGKYVSIAYQPVKEASDGVTVNVRAASLILLNVEGEIVKSGELTNFSIPDDQNTDQPFTFNATFKNTGNTHVKPVGSIEIMDLEKGEKLTKIAKYIDPESNEEVISDQIPINYNKTNVLPNSDRIFTSEWSQNIREGNFKAILELSYVENSNPIRQEFEFEIKENIAIDEFKINSGEGETNFDLSLTNQSTGKQKITGSIIINNSFNYKVGEISLGDNEYLAPGESKKINLEWLKKDIPKGVYTASLVANYGFTKKELSKEIEFGDRDLSKILLFSGLVLVTMIALVSIFRNTRKKGRRIK